MVTYIVLDELVDSIGFCLYFASTLIVVLLMVVIGDFIGLGESEYLA